MITGEGFQQGLLIAAIFAGLFGIYWVIIAIKSEKNRMNKNKEI